MAAFCIKPELAAELKAAAKKGEITMQKLFEMSSEERNGLFAKYADKETATQINAGFEKAMASNQQTVLNNWVKRTFSSRDKQNGRLADVASKIQSLNEMGVLTPKNEKEFLNDLVSTKLGVTVTADEAKNIAERADKLQELQKEVGTAGIGNPLENTDAQIKYMKAKEEMTNYLASLTPTSNFRVALGTIGRGMMVFSIHSPMVNIISHSVIAAPEMLVRRMESRQVQGLNNDLARAYMKHSYNIFRKSGFDISRFESLGGERKSLGEDYAHSQGGGIVRWTGRAVENTVFKHLHGDLYQIFAAFHFADSANLVSTTIAKAEKYTTKGDEKARAREIMLDAMLTEPKTDIGRTVRAKAEADATYATFTNKSVTSDIALGIRSLVNKGTGEFRLGDVLIPFAKVPANALGTSFEYAGVPMTKTLATGLYKTFAGLVGREPFDKENFAGMQRQAIRAGLGLTFATVISQMIKPEDFIGAWPTNQSEQKLQNERNGVTNSIRVGGKWVSLDYLGNNGAALLGIMYAKKYGTQTALDWIYRYSQGPLSISQNIPGIAEAASITKFLVTPPTQKVDSGTFAHTEAKTVVSQLTSRIIPSLLSDVAKMTDPYQRAVDKTSIMGNVQASIPGLRKGLPIAKNIFGEEQKSEPYLSTLLFGSRVKSSNDSQLLQELVKLDHQGEIPSITDVSKSSKSMQQLKQQIGDQQFNEAMRYFGVNLKQTWTDTIKSDDYKNADSAAAQRKMLDDSKAAVLKDTLDTYNYEKPEKP